MAGMLQQRLASRRGITPLGSQRPCAECGTSTSLSGKEIVVNKKVFPINRSLASGTLALGFLLGLGACARTQDSAVVADSRDEDGALSGQAVTEWIAIKSPKADDAACLATAKELGLEAQVLGELGFYVLTSRTISEKPLQSLQDAGCIDSFTESEGVMIAVQGNLSGQAVTSWIAVIGDKADLARCSALAMKSGLKVTQILLEIGVISFEASNTNQAPLRNLVNRGCITSFEPEGDVSLGRTQSRR